MNLSKSKFELKIFQIDENYFEIRNKSFSDVINVIKTNHIKGLRHKFADLDIKIVDPQIKFAKDEHFQFCSYCFRQPKEKFYWTLFLPSELTEGQNFDVVEFSYVLFIKYRGSIYCVISGSGMNVIKKYVHSSFGIEIYKKIASPTEDNIVQLEIRSIANNVSSKRETFHLNQTVSETLNYSDVPKKIKLIIREELKKTVFKEYKLSDNSPLMIVGSFFFLKKKLSFDELKHLIIKLNNINEQKETKQLTLFTRIDSTTLIKKLDNTLLELVVNDVQLHREPDKVSFAQKNVIELVHPSKLERFYECEDFVIRFKHSKGKKDLIVEKRTDLYFYATKHIFENKKSDEKFDIIGDIYRQNIRGRINGKEKTYGTFLSHLTAEVVYEGKKYYRIDETWYILEDKFLKKMNEDAKSYYRKYRLEESILNEWKEGDDEETYNKSHQDLEGYYVLDRVISKENIELCDILHITDNKAYFIHVKNGFDTKMRDLYIQVILAAKKLSNDLNNSSGINYLKSTLKKYNARNPKTINLQSFIDRIIDHTLEVHFVMAFKNNYRKSLGIYDRIDKSNSNIAKYSLVQVVREMQEFDFEINLIDISEINN